MENNDTRAQLKDVLNYAPEQYLTDAEITVIQATFKDNHFLLNALRKILWPTIFDAQTPIEFFAKDSFNAGREWASIPADEVKILVTARQDAEKFIIGGLLHLKNIANQPTESADEASLRQGKDSAK